MEQSFKQLIEKNPASHILCDEMPVGTSGLPTKVLKELSMKIAGANVIKHFSVVINIWAR